jgi:hypothetical protein
VRPIGGAPPNIETRPAALAHRDQAENVAFALAETLSLGVLCRQMRFGRRQPEYGQVSTRRNIGRRAEINSLARAIGHQQLKRAALYPIALELLPPAAHGPATFRSREIVDPSVAGPP